MDQATLMWVLTGALGLVLSALAYLAKTMVSQVLKKLDSIIIELQNLTRVTDAHESRIDNVMDDYDTMKEDIQDHSQRLTRLEIQINS